jgi:enoyl-[acyl-carrier protein] reductase I
MFAIDLSGKKGLILGVTNQRSIGWGIAQATAEAGARLAFGYQGERLLPALEKLTADLDDPLLLPCDVQFDEQIDELFAGVEASFGKLDFVVHSLAYAPPETFANPFNETARAAWQTALDVSAYSLVAIANRAAPLLKDGGSITSLSYLAAERVVPQYNVMGVAKAALEASSRYLAYELGPRGIRVNVISAGPVRTVAARSITGFGDMYSEAGRKSMLGRNITQEEVAGAALALISDRLGSGITGETIYVDAGYHAIGMFLPESGGEGTE